MTDTPPTAPSGPSPGQIALSVMGWLELGISVLLFAVGVPVAAGGFAVAALFLTFTATQIRRQRAEYLQRTAQAAEQPDQPRRSGTAFWVQLGAAGLLLAASVGWLIAGRPGNALLFLLWGLVLGLFAHRASQPH